jgi:hypothetical protein
MAMTRVEQCAASLEELFSADGARVYSVLVGLEDSNSLAFHTLPGLIYFADKAPVSEKVGQLTRQILGDFREAIEGQELQEQLRELDALVNETLSDPVETKRAIAAAELGNSWWRLPVTVWALQRAIKDPSLVVQDISEKILSIVLQRHRELEARDLEPLTSSSFDIAGRPEYQEYERYRRLLRDRRSSRGFIGVAAINEGYSGPGLGAAGGVESVEELADQVGGGDSGRSLHAMSCLAQLGDNAGGALPDLCVQLKSPELRRRLWAAFALGSLGKAGAVALPCLSLAYWDDDRRVREAVGLAQSKIREALQSGS